MRAVVARGGFVAVGVLAVLAGAVLALGAVGNDDGGSGPPEILPEVPVTPMDLSRGFANNSPNLAADPTDGRFVAMANRIDAPDFSCGLQVSGDRGRTWRSVNVFAELPPGADKCYAGEAAFDGDGTLYYLFVGLEGPGNEPMGAFLTSSTDAGRTFARPREVLGPLNYAVRMAIDPDAGDRGRIHLAWLHAGSDPPLGGFAPPPNPIQAAYSDDGGRTFSEPVQVSDPARERVVAPALALGPDGSVQVAYYDLEDDARDYQGLAGPPFEGTWSIVLAISTDGGRTFGRGSLVDDAIGPDERVLLIFTMPPPALAVDHDRTCLAWTDARTGDADAVLRCSSDGGRSWSDLRRLNDDPAGNGRRQYQPRIGLAPNGRLDAVFYDRRADPDDQLNQVSYTFSTDGARSFAPNRTLTSDPSSTLVGQRYAIVSAQGLVEWGSRMGLLSLDEVAMAAWTDTRNSRGGTGQDLFSASVEFPEGSDPVWLRVVGAALVVVGVLGVASGARPRRRGTDG